jgi:hypothetical protein
LEHIKSLGNLETLLVQQTAIGDKGLEHLERLTSLKNVDVRETKVTGDGLKKLKLALPKVTVKDE